MKATPKFDTLIASAVESDEEYDHVIGRDVMRDATSEVDDLIKDNARLREALLIFGAHDENCVWHQDANVCDCGLHAALDPA